MDNNNKMMKIWMLLALLQVLIACNNFPDNKGELPTWYGSLKHPQNIIGYGIGSNRKEAILNAQADVSTQMKVTIKSESRIHQQKNNDQSYSQFASFNTASDIATLSNVKVIKEEYRNGKYFIASSYDPRSSSIILAEKLKRSGTNNCINLKGVGFLSNSSFIQSLVQQFQNLPSPCKHLPIQFDKKDGLLTVTVQGFQQILNDYDIKLLLYSFLYNSTTLAVELVDPIKIHPISSKMKNGQGFKFLVAAEDNGGYINIFNIHGSGDINLVIENQTFLDKGVYPNSGWEIEATLDSMNEKVTESYLIVVSPNRLELISQINLTHLINTLEIQSSKIGTITMEISR